MIHVKLKNSFINTAILSFLVLGLSGSCSGAQKESDEQGLKAGCVTRTEAQEKKEELENSLRGQVKFLGEPEDLRSISDKMSDYRIPAVSLAIIDEGTLAWSAVYQNAEFKEVQELDCSNIFQAASLSKPVTFMAALRMQAAGKIDLDKDIQEYLKDDVLPEGAQTAENPVTLRNLFSHTSGINTGGYQGYAQGLRMPADLEVLRGGDGVNSAAISVVTPPGEVLTYSGGGYTLAEVALQDIFKEPFERIMKEWILDPVGMQHSQFTQPLPEAEAAGVARGYWATGKPLDGGWHNHPEQAAAGLWSNANDMAKFMIEIYKGYHGKSRVFSQADIRSILSHERDGHVYGFMVNRSADDIAITHYGGNAGYRTGMTISLSSGKGLVYLINSDNGGPLGSDLLLSASQVYGWQHFKQMSAKRKDVGTVILQGLAGKYRWNDQIELVVTYDEEKGQIALIFPNGDTYELVPVDGDELDLIHPNTGVQVSFSLSDNLQSFTLYGQKAVKL